MKVVEESNVCTTSVTNKSAFHTYCFSLSGVAELNDVSISQYGNMTIWSARDMALHGPASLATAFNHGLYCLVSPSPENFCKIDSEMVQSVALFTLKLPDQANSLICPASP